MSCSVLMVVFRFEGVVCLRFVVCWGWVLCFFCLCVFIVDLVG